jgi:hypothetical protein
MKRQLTYRLLALLLALSSSLLALSQRQQLDSLEGKELKVYYSKGHSARAQQLARLSSDAIRYAGEQIGLKPIVSLLILSPADWPLHTSFPVYGMPHYPNNQTLVIAAEDNAMWRSFIPPLDKLPSGLASQIRKVYRVNDTLTMQPFFDLLAIHELAHAYHQQGGLTMQRKWMGELFCNIFLHTFIAEKHPGLLPALTVFPNMVVAGGKESHPFTTLEQFETHYKEIGSQHPRNYGWYQSRLHVAAREIYDAGGKSVLQKLWLALQSKEPKDDRQLAAQLSSTVHPSVASVLLNW